MPAPGSFPASATRYTEVNRVLVRVLVLNLCVAVAKLVYGQLSGAVSILADGFHSLVDSTSNVLAMVGVRAARRPPDDDHPYGHRKYETLSAAGIFVFLVLVLVEVTQASVVRLWKPAHVDVTPVTFAIMLGTLAVNVFVVWYEGRAAIRLNSEVLFADAMHTRSDLLTTLTVIAAMIGVDLGFPLLDPLAGLAVAVFIARAGFSIARQTTGILSDQIALPEDELRDVVMEEPQVLGCHRIRTRGPADHVFLDLHIWLKGTMSLDQAHRISHEVKDRVMARFPQIADAVIHIEPPPAGDPSEK